MSGPDRTYPRVPGYGDAELRDRLARRGRSDLYFLAQGILGYTKITPHTHAAFSRFVQGPVLHNDRPVRRRMIQMPRSHFKTTIGTIAHSIQLILNNPNVRILLVASSAQNAERFMKEIQNHFRYNELFRWLYPTVVPEDLSKTTWNKQEITVPRTEHWREPTIDTIGSKGDVQSRHYNWIKADDIIGEKELNSEAEMEKTIEWCSGLESLLVSPMHDNIDYIGTRWRMDDVYAWVEKFYSFSEDTKKELELGPHAVLKGELAIFRRKALENGEPIFPEMISKEFLIRFMNHNPERYAAQYANDPKAEGITTFREEWLKYYRREGQTIIWHDLTTKTEQTTRIGNLQRMVLFDPAVSEHKKSARNALLVVGVLKRTRMPLIFLLETRIGHYKPHEAVRSIFELDKEWVPDFFSIEKHGYQGALKYFIKESAERDRLPYPNIRPFPPKGTPNSELAKDERIKGLQPLFRDGQILIHETMLDFIEEYLYYPRGSFKDALDALAQGLVYWPTSESDDMQELERAWEEKIIASIDETGYGIKPGSPLSDSYSEDEHEDSVYWRGHVIRV